MDIWQQLFVLPGDKIEWWAEVVRSVLRLVIARVGGLGSVPVVRYHDLAKARAAVARAGFVVVQELFLTETAKLASVVLPATSFAEKDGTFVNIEGREQKIKQAIAHRGDSRPDWRILVDLMARLGKPMPYFSARDIYRELKKAR